MMLLAGRDFHCKPTELYDMPLFWIEWNFILNRALAKYQERQAALASRKNA